MAITNANATLADGVGAGIITNDDRPASFAIDDDFENGFGAWKNVTNDNANWLRLSGPVNPTTTGPESGNTNGDSAAYYIYMETKGASEADVAGEKEFLHSPLLDATTYAVSLSFNYHMWGSVANMGTLSVDVYDGTWHSNVWSVSGPQQTSATAPYAFTNVDLSAYQGLVTVRMRGTAKGGELGNIALDDITLEGEARNARPALTLGTRPFDNEETPTDQPSFDFVGDDPDGTGRILYQFQWSKDSTFESNVQTRTSGTDTGFVNTNNGADMSPFTEAQVVRYTIQPSDALAASGPNDAYFWRARAMDTGANGSGYFGDWTTTRSLRVNPALPDARWAQAAEGQFELDDLTDVSATGGSGMGLGGLSIIENYKPKDDQEGNTSTWYAQVFSHATEFTVTKIRVKMKRKSAGSHSFYLRATTGGATPVPLSGSGNNLATATRVYVASESTSAAWFEYVFDTPVTIPANTKYAIVDQKSSVAVWRRIRKNGKYANGTYCSSSADSTWTASSSIDNAFEIWGTTPATGGTVISPTIDASWRPDRVWKGLFVTDDETYGDIKYDVQYSNGVAWVNTPVTNLDSFPVDLSSLNPGTYSKIRLVARLTGTGSQTPFLKNWAVSWDDAYNLSIGNATVVEGAGGTTSAVFRVSLPAPVAYAVSMNFATSNGTATAGADYVATNGTLVLAAGQTSTSIVVAVKGDLLYEGASESFYVNLSNAVGAAIADDQGLGTITDDDAQPAIGIGSATVVEGDSGTSNANFIVSLSAVSGRDVSFAYATSNGSAAAGSDYTAGSGTATILAGQTAAIVTVSVTGDAIDEPVETFYVNLSAIADATLAVSQGLGSIIDDDGPPALFVTDTSVAEGSGGNVSAAFIVELLPASGLAVQFTYATSNGSAIAGGDYTAASGTVTMPAGQTSTSIIVNVAGDLLHEATETFDVVLSSLNNALSGRAQALGTILDDDAPPALAISDAMVTEGNSGTTNATFTITLAQASGLPAQFTYATADETAIAGSDYDTTSGSLSIPAGSISTTLTVQVSGDVTFESNETFRVVLANAVEATFLNDQGHGTIVDDDVAPAISIGDVAVTEGDSGTTTAVFTVTLSAVSGLDASFAYVTSNGTATAGRDFDASAGIATIPAGTLSTTITVAVNGDLALEGIAETFFVNLSSPVNATLADAQGLGSITDDDSAVSIGDASVLEVDSGTTSMVFTVSLTSARSTDVSVAYATSNGTATAGADYVATSGTLVILAGQTATSIVVNVIADLVYEGAPETFFANLSGASGATIDDAQGLGTILENDPFTGTVFSFQ